MNRRTQKPSISVSKVAAGYGVRLGTSRVAIFKTKAEAVDAAKELAHSGQGTLRRYTVASGSSRLLPTGIVGKRVLGSSSRATAMPPRPRLDGSQSDVKPRQPDGIQQGPDGGEAAHHSIRFRDAAGAEVTERLLVEFMVQKEDLRRRKGVGAGFAAITGLIGAIAAAVASLMTAATSPGLDESLLLGVLTVAALVVAILIQIIPGLLKSRTKTNAWAAKVAGAVWDDEMAGPSEIKRLSAEGRL